MDPRLQQLMAALMGRQPTPLQSQAEYLPVAGGQAMPPTAMPAGETPAPSPILSHEDAHAAVMQHGISAFGLHPDQARAFADRVINDHSDQSRQIRAAAFRTMRPGRYGTRPLY